MGQTISNIAYNFAMSSAFIKRLVLDVVVDALHTFVADCISRMQKFSRSVVSNAQAFYRSVMDGTLIKSLFHDASTAFQNAVIFTLTTLREISTVTSATTTLDKFLRVVFYRQFVYSVYLFGWNYPAFINSWLTLSLPIIELLRSILKYWVEVMTLICVAPRLSIYCSVLIPFLFRFIAAAVVLNNSSLYCSAQRSL
jgi:hypothetical protein